MSESPTSLRPAGVRRLRVLIVEDEPLDAELVVETLLQAGFECDWELVHDRESFLASLGTKSYDLILADHNLPSFDGRTALALARAHEESPPFVLVSGSIGEEEAIEALKAGATDYVLKTRLSRLAPVVRRAIHEQEEQRRRQEAEAERAVEAEINAALVRAASELVASLDTPTLLQRLCALTVEALRCERGVALLLDEDEAAFVPASADGVPPEQWEAMRLAALPLPVVQPLLDRLQAEEVLEVSSRDRDLLPAKVHEVLNGERALFAALRRGRRVVGLLVASRVDPFDERERRTARGIAQLASLVLANARVVEELRRVNQLKSDFVATLSHELRTPLNVILGFQDLLLEGTYGELDAEQQRPLARAQKSAQDLRELVQGTLDLGRLETGNVPVDVGDVDVREVVAVAADYVRPAMRDKPDVRLEIDVAAEMPRLRTDRGKLDVILRNLLANAVKFTLAGEVRLAVTPADEGVEIRVEDTGVGISKASLAVVFEPFRQVEPAATRAFGGVGLGLYIVRRLTETLGGAISVTSEPGRGSTFRLWLPLEWGRRTRATAAD